MDITAIRSSGDHHIRVAAHAQGKIWCSLEQLNKWILGGILRISCGTSVKRPEATRNDVEEEVVPVRTHLETELKLMSSSHDSGIPSKVVGDVQRGGGVVLGSICWLSDAIEPSNADIRKSQIYWLRQNNRKPQRSVVVSLICLRKETSFLVVSDTQFIHQTGIEDV